MAHGGPMPRQTEPNRLRAIQYLFIYFLPAPLALPLRMPASVNLLPEDVLREIFTHSVPPKLQLNIWSRSGPKAILILTHVCSRWRQIALSMPYLWSTIHVSQYHRPNLQFMHEWLSRAAAVPRTLFLELDQGGMTRGEDDLEPIHTIFASYPFQKLSVFPDCYYVGEDEDIFEPMIVLPNQLLEHLEELHLDGSRVMFPHDAKLPNLQSLSITSELGPGNFQHYSALIP